MREAWVAGVDGCKAGWVAVFRPVGEPERAEIEVFKTFEEILRAARHPVRVAVDMPMGLPDRVGRGGRGPEVVLRPLLGGRQSSVFSVPSRKAVYASDYSAACALALATSDPARKVSKQAFHLFPKIKEIDALLRDDKALVSRVFECHPEGSFRMMRGGALEHPKKVKSRPYAPGLAERRQLLSAQGYAAAFLAAEPPAGAADDDLLDGCAAAWTAARIASGEAKCFPQGEPERDAFGLPMAIWT
jgi:predicted RNase H-like nuclease